MKNSLSGHDLLEHTRGLHPRLEELGRLLDTGFVAEAANEADDQLSQADVHEAVRVLVLESDPVVNRKQFLDNVFPERPVSGCPVEHQLEVLQ